MTMIAQHSCPVKDRYAEIEKLNGHKMHFIDQRVPGNLPPRPPTSRSPPLLSQEGKSHDSAYKQ